MMDNEKYKENHKIKKNILVTGGAGFIGSHVAEYLAKKGHKVTILDDLSGGFIENVPEYDNISFVQGSIENSKLIDKVVKGKDIIYHIAAYAAEGLSHFIRNYNYNNNLIGSVNLINSAVKNNVDKFLFTSSMAVYGSGKPPFNEDMKAVPEDPYGISKYAVEMDLKAAKEMFNLDSIIIRPHNVYGEKQNIGDPYRNVIGIFMNRVMQGLPPLKFGDGKQTRAFSYIGDIAPCIAEAPFIPEATNEIINLGAGREYTINELADTVVNAMGVDIKPEHAPKRFEVEHAYCTTEKSKRILGFQDKTSLKEGITKMTEWAKKKGPMPPTIWDGYELTKNLPEYWQNMEKEYKNANKRK